MVRNRHTLFGTESWSIHVADQCRHSYLVVFLSTFHLPDAAGKESRQEVGEFVCLQEIQAESTCFISRSMRGMRGVVAASLLYLEDGMNRAQ